MYRLISCGTVEEKIYRKQVFKGGLSRSGMEDGIPFQYFSQQVRASQHPVTLSMKQALERWLLRW